MRRSINWKKVLLISWAILLVFGLSFQAEQVEASHSSCGQECSDNCGDCAAYGSAGCGCVWVCEDGSRGRSICVV